MFQCTLNCPNIAFCKGIHFPCSEIEYRREIFYKMFQKNPKILEKEKNYYIGLLSFNQYSYYNLAMSHLNCKMPFASSFSVENGLTHCWDDKIFNIKPPDKVKKRSNSSLSITN